MDKVLDPASEKAFLADLVSKKLGTEITFEEAKNISTGIKEVVARREVIPENSPIRSKERIDYGLSESLFRDYISALKQKDTRGIPKKIQEFITSPRKIINVIGGTAKSLLSTLDNSFIGRQGYKMLASVRNADIWARAFITSWKYIIQELAGYDAMTPIKADVFSRPNALNGKYRAGNYDVGIKFEESFPVSYPGRIPLLGRVFKAAESAFNGTALRMRADYADRVIARAEKYGKDVLESKEAQSLGKLVNSMTGRGSIGKLGVIGNELNVAVFSIRFFKSNFDVLTAHMLDPKMSRYAKVEAAKNLAGIITTTAAILWTANQLFPDSVDWDPRSANFGKIRIGDTRFDVSGGMASLITLASRITPTMHNGEWGFYSKSATTGKITKLNSGKWGAMTVMDVINNYWQNKLSPIAGILRDVARGRTFAGEKPTPLKLGIQAITPLPVQTFFELKNNPESADLLMSMILEGLGISANTYSK